MGTRRDSCDNSLFYYLIRLLHFFEFILGRAAPGADPPVRNIFKSRSGFDTAVWVSHCRVVNIVAKGTFPLVHTIFMLIARLNCIVSQAAYIFVTAPLLQVRIALYEHETPIVCSHGLRNEICRASLSMLDGFAVIGSRRDSIFCLRRRNRVRIRMKQWRRNNGNAYY